MVTVLRAATPNCSRRATRSRNGASEGAPASRLPWWWAATSRTTMSSCPSWAPPSTTCRVSTSGWSLRQLVPRVRRSPAVSAAWRYVAMSPPRNA